MLNNPSLVVRIGIGKLVGLLIGLTGFLLMPSLWPDAPPLLRWGVLFWYATVGAVIGVFGIFTEHPILKLPLPWWLRSLIIGAWMNFVLALFAWDVMAAMLSLMFGATSILASPLWFIVEGAAVGLIIGYLATKFGGEGRETAAGLR